MGYNALWDSGLIRKFRKNYFVYTDSDVVLSDECPADILEKAYSILGRYSKVHKVGPALEVKDIPEENWKAVWNTQSDSWQKVIHGDDFLLYEAMIDTTFALYRPFVTKHLGVFRNQIRMGYPYVAKHMPWYERENHMPEDSLYYQQKANIESTWYKRS